MQAKFSLVYPKRMAGKAVEPLMICFNGLAAGN